MISERETKNLLITNPDGLIVPQSWEETLEKGIRALREDGVKNQEELIKCFGYIRDQNHNLENQLNEANRQLRYVTDQLKKSEKLREEREARILARKNRVRKEESDPMLLEDFERLMLWLTKQELNIIIKDRLLVTYVLLFLTGFRIGGVLNLRVYNVSTLLQQRPFLQADRLKGGPKQKKAFLTQTGKRIVKKYKADLEVFIRAKVGGDYLMTGIGLREQISRSHYNREVNKYIRGFGKVKQRNFTSHSFRKGFITHIWKDTTDLELVRQIIGHKSIATTSKYVQSLSNEEVEEKMENIK